MLEGITIVGKVILFTLAGYGIYNLYLSYKAKKEEEEKNNK